VEDDVRGVLITFEGVEGSGKTTQMTRLVRWLKEHGHKVERTEEPDGTALGVAIRRVFEQPATRPRPLAEMFLFMAARHQHVVEKIRPWLTSGRIVVCDRYTDATLAYQGYGRGLDTDVIREMNLRATGGTLPALTLLFDVRPEEGLKRIGARRLDHFEKEALAFHRRVRRGYLEIQRAEPKRVRIIDAGPEPDHVEHQVRSMVTEFLRGA
jgi:dTMP kinase